MGPKQFGRHREGRSHCNSDVHLPYVSMPNKSKGRNLNTTQYKECRSWLRSRPLFRHEVHLGIFWGITGVHWGLIGIIWVR